MSIVPREISRRVEWYLLRQDQVRRNVLVYRGNILFQGYPGGGGAFSDPTAERAIRLAEPPPREKELEGWLRVIEGTRAHLGDSKAGRYYRLAYRDRLKEGQILDRMGLCRRQSLCELREKVVLVALLYAVKEGLVELPGAAEPDAGGKEEGAAAEAGRLAGVPMAAQKDAGGKEEARAAMPAPPAYAARGSAAGKEEERAGEEEVAPVAAAGALSTAVKAARSGEAGGSHGPAQAAPAPAGGRIRAASGGA